MTIEAISSRKFYFDNSNSHMLQLTRLNAKSLKASDSKCRWFRTVFTPDFDTNTISVATHVSLIHNEGFPIIWLCQTWGCFGSTEQSVE